MITKMKKERQPLMADTEVQRYKENFGPTGRGRKRNSDVVNEIIHKERTMVSSLEGSYTRTPTKEYPHSCVMESPRDGLHVLRGFHHTFVRTSYTASFTVADSMAFTGHSTIFS